MASSLDSWTREHNEGLKLSEEINEMISERSSLAERGYDPKRHASILQSLLAKSPEKPISEKEMTKARELASAMKMSKFANIDSSLGSDDIMSRVIGMDNQAIVGFQRQVMREQDELLENFEETVINTRRIALAINEDLDLQTRLIEDLGHHVEISASGLTEAENSLGRGVCMTIIYSVLGFFRLA